jgi:PHD/YefM family antitoxin component YafN of YafNO toxin-antitoxin module
MLKVSAAEFQRNIGRYQDLALREPIAVTRNGRESCILLSTDEYRRLKRRDREVLSISDFTDAEAEAVLHSEGPLETAEFDHELES